MPLPDVQGGLEGDLDLVQDPTTQNLLAVQAQLLQSNLMTNAQATTVKLTTDEMKHAIRKIV